MMMGGHGIATQRNADPGGSDVQEQASEFGAPKRSRTLLTALYKDRVFVGRVVDGLRCE